jgi:thioredoxin reductase (NADPH)
MKLDFDVVVVGAGIAGMTAAIYLKRANINVVMIEHTAPGGQVNRTSSIENYPGFEKIDGPTLAYNTFMQTQKLGINYKYGNVIDVTVEDEYKIVRTDKEEIKCKAIIIATGRKAKELGLKNELSLTGRGISWCAICDAPLYKNMNVAVVGGGNSALEEAIYLSEICSKVTLIHRRNEFRADKILVDQVVKSPKIEIKYNSVITDINESNNRLNDLVIENVETKDKETLDVSALFILIGSIPVTDLLKDTEVEVDNGYVVVDSEMRTKVEGIYACGDVIKKSVYQVSTAVGEGATAAMSAIKYINESNK